MKFTHTVIFKDYTFCMLLGISLPAEQSGACGIKPELPKLNQSVRRSRVSNNKINSVD